MIFKVHYNKYDANASGQDKIKQEFYRCIGNDNYINYIIRKSAIDNDSIDDITFKNFNDGEGNYLGYLKERHGSTGIFSSNLNVSKKQLKILMENFRNNKDIVYDSIVSFRREDAENVVFSKATAHKLALEIIKKLFSYKNISMDDIYFLGAFHTNTENPHFHLQIGIKNLDKNFDPHFKKSHLRGIQKFIIDYLLLNRNKDFNYNNRNIIVQYFKVKNKEDLKYNRYFFLKNELFKDGKEIPLQFNRLPKDKKLKINNFIFNEIKINDNLNKIYNQYLNDLDIEYQKLLNYYKNTALEIPSSVKNFYVNRKTDLHNRIANTILKSLIDMESICYEYEKVVKFINENINSNELEFSYRNKKFNISSFNKNKQIKKIKRMVKNDIKKILLNCDSAIIADVYTENKIWEYENSQEK